MSVSPRAALPQKPAASTGPAAPDLHKEIAQFRAQVVRFQQEQQAFEKEKKKQSLEWQAQREDVQEREQALEKQVAQKLHAQAKAAPAPTDKGLLEKQALLDAGAADLEKQRQDLAGMRQELADIRRQLYERYQERRDRLSGLQEAVDRAARKVQERKRQIDSEEAHWAQRRQEQAACQADLDQRTADLASQAQRIVDERRRFSESQTQAQDELAAKLGDLEAREAALALQQRDLDAKLQQYQADVLRLDRLQGALEDRQKKIDEDGRALEDKIAQLQRDSAELEEQVTELDNVRTQLQEETASLARHKEEQAVADQQLTQRAASLEGQQATLAALRTRMDAHARGGARTGTEPRRGTRPPGGGPGGD